MAARQVPLPRVARGRFRDRHPRAPLYHTMRLLGACEERALTAVEDEEVADWEAAERELARCTLQAQDFYRLVIAPLARGWWLA